jgi:hypothetical protein
MPVSRGASAGRGIASSGSSSASRSASSRRLSLPLKRRDPMGGPLEITMAWCPVPLWLAPDEAVADVLVAQGIPRGRIWLMQELLDLLAIPGLTPAGARRLAHVKLEFDGVLDDHLAGLIEPIPGASTPAVVPERPGWLPGLEPPA